MRYALAFLSVLWLTSAGTATQAAQAADAVESCGGLRITLGLEGDGAEAPLVDMAQVLEHRLEMWPDPLENVTVNGNTLQIYLPLGMGDPTGQLDMFLRQGVFQAHLVEEVIGDDAPRDAAADAAVWRNPRQSAITYWALGPSFLATSDIQDSKVTGQQGQPAIMVTLRDAAATRVAKLTADNIGKHIALILDDEVLIAARVMTPIPGGQLVISGGQTQADAEAKARLLRSGSLAQPLYVSSITQVGPGDAARCGELFSN